MTAIRAQPGFACTTLHRFHDGLASGTIKRSLTGSDFMPGYVYMMTNRPNGTLYCGVTNDIAR